LEPALKHLVALALLHSPTPRGADAAGVKGGLIVMVLANAEVQGGPAFLVNPTNSGGGASTRDMAAHRLGQPIVVVGAGTAGEVEMAFASLAEQKVRGLIISADAFFASRRGQIIALAARQAMPTMHLRWAHPQG
jgi:hypothetical protein